ncbi:hypothetical protein SAMN05216325_13324 [Nitrosomonas marina]|uniref:Uncharacterized protein n=1 Tax=Nitrosomonas marina TaxID=917 RepID=A0A1H8II92_9PROT|nr:hypothetical protein SAMN05216325_13324 [Nitrosomonas marina]
MVIHIFISGEASRESVFLLMRDVQKFISTQFVYLFTSSSSAILKTDKPIRAYAKGRSGLWQAILKLCSASQISFVPFKRLKCFVKIGHSYVIGVIGHYL